MAADERAPSTGGPPDEEAGGGAPGGEIIGATLEGLRRAAEEVEQVATLAETLQRSLLPETLPEIPGITLAARYVAGSVNTQVGGDWYDAVPLRDGRVGLAIGDVVGHGLDAAARMARLQNALRAYALEGLRPSLLLERMNGFAREVTGGPMATLLFASVDADEGQLVLASAGHPPPLILYPGGDARYAEGPPGSPLGVVPFPSFEESVIPVLPGTTILFYTDGLVERPDISLDEGLDWLREFVLAEGTAEPEALCAALLSGRFRAAAPHDDVALLAVRLEPVGSDPLTLTLKAEPEELAGVRRALARWLRAAGAGETEVYEGLVACGEACANAISHAYSPGDASFVVEAERTADGFEIRVRDFGSWRPPRAGSRGRGLALIEELVDELDIERSDSGTTVTMRRVLSGSPAG